MRGHSGQALLLAAMVAFSATVHAEPAAEVEGLLDVYELALEAEPRLRGRHREVEEVQALRDGAFGGLLPEISLRGSVRRVRRDQTSTDMFGDEQDIERTFTSQQYGLSFTQPLYNVAAWRRLESADEELARAELELEAERQALMQRVVESYLRVLNAQSVRELAQREEEAIATSLEQVEALYEEGLVSITELEEVRARRDNARAGALRAESDVEIAREELAEVTDRHHRRLAGLHPDAELPDVVPADIDVWTRRAHENNPALLAARAGVEATRHDMRAARAEHLPTVDLIAGYDRIDDDVGEVDGSSVGREFDDASIGIQVSVPLYSGGRTSARTRAVDNRRERELEELEATRRSVRTAVRSAFLALASGRSELRAQAQAVRSNERNVEAMEAGFEAGERSIVDVVDAQRDLFAQRRALTEIRHEYLIQTLALKAGAGMLETEDIVALDMMFGARPAD